MFSAKQGDALSPRSALLPIYHHANIIFHQDQECQKNVPINSSCVCVFVCVWPWVIRKGNKVSVVITLHNSTLSVVSHKYPPSV